MFSNAPHALYALFSTVSTECFGTSICYILQNSMSIENHTPLYLLSKSNLKISPPLLPLHHHHLQKTNKNQSLQYLIDQQVTIFNYKSSILLNQSCKNYICNVYYQLYDSKSSLTIKHMCDLSKNSTVQSCQKLSKNFWYLDFTV